MHVHCGPLRHYKPVQHGPLPSPLTHPVPPPQVGVVRQVESAAIKKAGDNKSGPFERRMTALHTRATLEVRPRSRGWWAVAGQGWRLCIQAGYGRGQ